MEFIFAIFYLLWFAIKGIFKLAWMFISLPFKLIKAIHNEIKYKKKREEAAAQKAAYDEKMRQVVETLYQRIITDFLNCSKAAPVEKIIVNYSNIEFIYANGQRRTLPFSSYNCDCLAWYSTYWVTDGSSSEDSINQLLLLAQKLNYALNGTYSIRPTIKESTTSSYDETMHNLIQMDVVMLKNK